MKILLINPPGENLIKFVSALDLDSKEFGGFPPFGLLCIAANLKHKTDFEVKIIDAVLEKFSYEQLRNKINEYRPDIAGISAFTPTWVDALKTAELIKNVNKNIHVCMGGPHTYHFSKETILQKSVDSVALGEAEETFVEFARVFSKTRSIKGVEGFLSKDASGEVTETGQPGYIEDLDSLPYPSLDLYPYEKCFTVLGGRSLVASLITSRGCPFDCTFCGKLYKSYRMRSVENVFEEMKQYYDKGIDEFFFFDDMFNIKPQRVIDISKVISQEGMKISFSFRGRVDQVSEEMALEAKKAGCKQVFLGVEDATDEGLKKINKKINLKHVLEAIKIYQKAGIEVCTNYIIGFPHHKTRKDVLNVINFALKTKPDYAQFNILLPYYGTKVFDEGIKCGVIRENAWKNFAEHPSPDFVPDLWTENFSKAELRNLLKFCYFKFYFRPRFILQSLYRLRSIHEIKRKIRAASALLSTFR